MQKQTISNFLAFCLFLISSFTIGAQTDATVQIINDLLYVDADEVQNDSLQRLNLILPQESGAPLLLWIGGGAWSYVDRHVEVDFAKQMAKRGIAVAAVGHRLSPAIWRDPALNTGIHHPAHIEDIAAAFKWLYDHAKEYGYDQNQLFVGGFSSGAQLAALLALDPKHLAKHALNLDAIKGIVPIAGAYDIVNYYEVLANGARPEMGDQHVKAVFGETEADFLDASPTSYLENLSVPILLISENRSFNYTRIFEDQIRATDFRDLLVVHVHKLGHGALWKHLSFEDYSIYREIIIDFIRHPKDL